MFRLADDLRVYLHRDPIDFRAGINSLAILVEQSMGLSPFERAVFVFCNRRRTRMKLLFFERSGFVLVLKALSEDRFRWPRREAAVVTLDTEQLRIDQQDRRAGQRNRLSSPHEKTGADCPSDGDKLEVPVGKMACEMTVSSRCESTEVRVAISLSIFSLFMIDA